MKLINFKLTVNDFGATPPDDGTIDMMLDDMRDAVYAAVGAVANNFDVVVHVEED